MTRVPPRTNFHSSKLIRCLADLAVVNATDAGNAFAEKLGLWIHFTDAITLSTVHGDSVASAPGTQPEIRRTGHERQAAARDAVDVEFERIRTSLTTSILQSCSSGSARVHIRLPTPAIELPMDRAAVAAAYAPYRRFYEAHQRDMELRIQPLRVNLRAALAKASPRLRKLAELDATLEKILHDRERKLLASVPVLLKKRFEQLFNEHQQKLVDTQQAEDRADNPAARPQPEAWLARFCKDMQMLLLAEADFRLQPALGLMEAFKQDTQ